MRISVVTISHLRYDDANLIISSACQSVSFTVSRIRLDESRLCLKSLVWAPTTEEAQDLSKKECDPVTRRETCRAVNEVPIFLVSSLGYRTIQSEETSTSTSCAKARQPLW
jgi:hypothetical protein